MKKLLSLFIVLIAIYNVGFSQSMLVADDLLADQNFEEALDIYEQLLEQQKDDKDLNYKIGVCYLNTHIDKTKSIPFLEKANRDNDYDNNVNYLLGRAYHYANRFDDAIAKFREYINNDGGTASSISETYQQIEFCENAKELVKFPLNLEYESLGDGVNSTYPDYFPFVPVDESFIVFNSKRNDGSMLLDNGTFVTNIYYAGVKDGKFVDAKPLGDNINTPEFNEEVVGLSADGKTMLIYQQSVTGNGNLFISHKGESGFEKPVKLESTINSRFEEISATISHDGNMIIFTSDRKDGIGGTDLYISKKLPIGGWGPAQNMGEIINTPYNEDFPNLSPDGKTLYFSSKGHVSMGGYDIFRAEWNEKTNQFENVKNIGYPLNTSQDDMNFRVSMNRRYGYIAAVRPEGKGSMDIYRVTFKDVEPDYTVIRGKVTGINTGEGEEVYITVTDNKTGELYGSYMPNYRNMRYIIIVPPGEYNVFVEATGFEPIDENFTVMDKSDFKAEIIRDFEFKVK